MTRPLHERVAAQLPVELRHLATADEVEALVGDTGLTRAAEIAEQIYLNHAAEAAEDDDDEA